MRFYNGKNIQKYLYLNNVEDQNVQEQRINVKELPEYIFSRGGCTRDRSKSRLLARN